ADLNTMPRRFLPGLGKFELPSLNIYARGANGNTAPVRVIKGPKTQLNWPSHVAVHEERGEIFVANDADDSILVFRVSDSGDAAPLRVIRGGPENQIGLMIGNPGAVGYDSKRQQILVPN